MATFVRNFTKTVYGFASVEASTLEEAQAVFDEGMFDEFDNNSDYDWTSEINKEGDE